MPLTKRTIPAGSVKINLTLVPGSDEYSAYVSIKNKYQDEMTKRRKANPTNQLCKTDTGNCELARGALYALDQVPQDELPDYINSAWKPKGRHTLNAEIKESEKQANPNADLDERDTILH